VKRALTVLLISAVLAAPLAAQERAGGRFPRKWLVAGVGMLFAGTVATLYAVSFENDIGGCSSSRCVVPVSVGMGGLLGFMIGAELDKLYHLRYGHAPPMSLRGAQLPLSVEPNDLALRNGMVYVSGTDAVEIVEASPELRRGGLKARGLRGIGPVAPDHLRTSLLVGTAVGLYRFPLTTDDPGSLAYPGEISAMSSDANLLALGLGPEFRVVRVADSLEERGAALPEDARVVDLAWQGADRLWVLTEDRLVAYDVGPAGELAVRGEGFPFPAIARRLSVVDSLAYVAAGSGGVYALDLRDPDLPVERANWSGARFVYDVAVVGDRVYLASGPEGLYVLHLGATGFSPLGLSRNVGFVAAVEAGAEALYLLDRSGLSLRRVPVPPVQ
jgi:hypothetical protein